MSSECSDVTKRQRTTEESTSSEFPNLTQINTENEIELFCINLQVQFRNNLLFTSHVLSSLSTSLAAELLLMSEEEDQTHYREGEGRNNTNKMVKYVTFAISLGKITRWRPICEIFILFYSAICDSNDVRSDGKKTHSKKKEFMECILKQKSITQSLFVSLLDNECFSTLKRDEAYFQFLVDFYSTDEALQMTLHFEESVWTAQLLLRSLSSVPITLKQFYEDEVIKKFTNNSNLSMEGRTEFFTRLVDFQIVNNNNTATYSPLIYEVLNLLKNKNNSNKQPEEKENGVEHKQHDWFHVCLQPIVSGCLKKQEKNKLIVLIKLYECYCVEKSFVSYMMQSFYANSFSNVECMVDCFNATLEHDSVEIREWKIKSLMKLPKEYKKCRVQYCTKARIKQQQQQQQLQEEEEAKNKKETVEENHPIVIIEEDDFLTQTTAQIESIVKEMLLSTTTSMTVVDELKKKLEVNLKSHASLAPSKAESDSILLGSKSVSSLFASPKNEEERKKFDRKRVELVQECFFLYSETFAESLVKQLLFVTSSSLEYVFVKCDNNNKLVLERVLKALVIHSSHSLQASLKALEWISRLGEKVQNPLECDLRYVSWLVGRLSYGLKDRLMLLEADEAQEIQLWLDAFDSVGCFSGTSLATASAFVPVKEFLQFESFHVIRKPQFRYEWMIELFEAKQVKLFDAFVELIGKINGAGGGESDPFLIGMVFVISKMASERFALSCKKDLQDWYWYSFQSQAKKLLPNNNNNNANDGVTNLKQQYLNNAGLFLSFENEEQKQRYLKRFV